MITLLRSGQIQQGQAHVTVNERRRQIANYENLSNFSCRWIRSLGNWGYVWRFFIIRKQAIEAGEHSVSATEAATEFERTRITAGAGLSTGEGTSKLAY